MLAYNIMLVGFCHYANANQWKEGILKDLKISKGNFRRDVPC